MLFLHNHRAKILFLLRFLADYIPGVGLVARKWDIFSCAAWSRISCVLSSLEQLNYVCFLSAQVRWWNTYPFGRRSTFTTGAEAVPAEKVMQTCLEKRFRKCLHLLQRPHGMETHINTSMRTSCDNLSCRWSRSSVTQHVISVCLASFHKTDG